MKRGMIISNRNRPRGGAGCAFRRRGKGLLYATTATTTTTTTTTYREWDRLRQYIHSLRIYR